MVDQNISDRGWQEAGRSVVRAQIYILRNVDIFCDLDAKEWIQELKSISQILQSLNSSLKKVWTINTLTIIWMTFILARMEKINEFTRKKQE